MVHFLVGGKRSQLILERIRIKSNTKTDRNKDTHIDKETHARTGTGMGTGTGNGHGDGHAAVEAKWIPAFIEA